MFIKKTLHWWVMSYSTDVISTHWDLLDMIANLVCGAHQNINTNQQKNVSPGICYGGWVINMICESWLSWKYSSIQNHETKHTAK